jgi:hypothetical protein
MRPLSFRLSNTLLYLAWKRPGEITQEPILVYFVSGGKHTKEIMTNWGGL